MRIRQSLPQPYIQRCRSPGRCNSWELEFRDCGAIPEWARAAVDCGETDQGDVKEETLVGNACGEKLGSHGSKVILQESRVGGGAITIASLPTQQHWQLNKREAGPSNA